MDESAKRTQCERHGECDETFVCTHLPQGVACGFVSAAEPSDDDPWPDAWCSACEEVRAAEGEWNDVSEAFASIVLLCSGCYEEARARNQSPPAPLDAETGRLDEEQTRQLVRTACAHSEEAQRALDRRTGFLSYPQWYFDPEAGSLRFHGAESPDLVTRISLVGSFSTKSNTWMWGWENRGVTPEMLGDVWQLRGFGESRGVSRMSDGSWPATEEDGWHMASLAAYLLRAEGIYRAPVDHMMLFMLIHDLQPAR